MAAAPNHSLGFFSVVCSRLRAASSAWRRKPADDEATVRSRLARRAGAKRRLGRSLAFVSFNLELLLFVYAFWRARRRSFNWTWRQPLQALPILVIPALAALIYAASVRFIRALDLKDKKTLGRLQQQNDSAQRGSHSHHNDPNSAKKCAPVDEATSFASQSDPSLISKLDKHRLPSSNLGVDGGGDRSWGHIKDFHPNYMESTAEHHSNLGPDVVENGMAYSTETSPCLPGCSISLLVSDARGHADFCSQMNCPKSNGGLAEEDDVQTSLIRHKSDDLPVIAKLHHEGVENKSSKFHGLEGNRMAFVLEEEILMGPYAVQNIESHLGTSGYTLCSQEAEKENIAGGACIVEVVPELRFLSSLELVVESGNIDSKKESCTPNIDEENDIVVNSEEALLIMPAVNTAEQCSGTSGFSLRAQDSNMMEVPAITNIFSYIPESNYPASVELVAEDDETSDVNLPEQKHWEAFVDPLVVSAFEDSFATSESLSCSAVAKIIEVPVVVKEGISEEPSIHQNVALASSSDGGNTEYVMSGSVPAVLIPETNITGALQDGHETLFDPRFH